MIIKQQQTMKLEHRPTGCACTSISASWKVYNPLKKGTPIRDTVRGHVIEISPGSPLPGDITTLTHTPGWSITSFHQVEELTSPAITSSSRVHSALDNSWMVVVSKQWFGSSKLQTWYYSDCSVLWVLPLDLLTLYIYIYIYHTLSKSASTVCNNVSPTPDKRH